MLTQEEIDAREEVKRLKQIKVDELREKLEQKKALLAELAQDNENMLKKQEEQKRSMHKTISRD